MSLKERIEYERKMARLVTTIREEVAVCGLTEVQIQVDNGRPELTSGNHKVKIRSPAMGTIEFEIAHAWFDGRDRRSDDNLRFAARQAMRALSR